MCPPPSVLLEMRGKRQKERWCLLAAVNVREEHAVKLPDVNVSLLHVDRFLGDSLLSVIKVCVSSAQFAARRA